MPNSKKAALDEIRRVVALEAKALGRMLGTIDGRWARAVEMLAACRGKVIVTGVGKSGLVAQKIAATFSSTGTPAMFLDPGEALHGGLGAVQRGDLVLALGKSGESEELNTLLPALSSRKVRLLVITANARSTLGKAADLVLDMPIPAEACPLNLAPTTSTTVAMALGDALAVALMKRRGFKAEHFAANHPAGRLGRRLHLRVKDVMRAGPDNPTVLAHQTTRDLLSVITRLQAGAASVVDKKGRFLGLVTDFDIRRALGGGADFNRLTVREVMNPKPTTISPDALAAEALEAMEDRNNPFNVLPVVDKKGRSVGLIQTHDLRARGL
ncbi:MAG: KpsF/GutQ family sugar-phosphate isomerase [Elusimicrobia bacterium]|nr:KpsF/GutQ family sugar-phosphate isomerase [Elusimicrobiota bacterium]